MELDHRGDPASTIGIVSTDCIINSSGTYATISIRNYGTTNITKGGIALVRTAPTVDNRGTCADIPIAPGSTVDCTRQCSTETTPTSCVYKLTPTEERTVGPISVDCS